MGVPVAVAVIGVERAREDTAVVERETDRFPDPWADFFIGHGEGELLRSEC